MLFHGLHARCRCRIARIGVGRAEVHIFDEAARGHSRRRTAGRAAAADVGGGGDAGVIRIVHGVNALVPVVAAEGTARQAHFHDVVELAVAGKDLELAVVQHVVGAADAGSNFLTPAEIERGEARRIVRRHVLLIEADAQVQSQAMSDVPGILKIDGMRSLLSGAGVGNGLAADDEVPVPALADRLTEVRQVRGHDAVAGRSVGDRNVALAPVEVHIAAVEEAQNIFRLPLPEIPDLKRVGTAQEMGEIGGIHGEALALERIMVGVQVVRDIGKPTGVERRCGEGLAGQVLAGRVDGGIVDVARAGGGSALFVVGEVVAVAGGDHQLGGGRPVAAETVGARAD